MEMSLDRRMDTGLLTKKRKRFYNYIILRSGPLYKLLEYFYTIDLETTGFDLGIEHLLYFIKSIVYIGKGCGYRCISHCKDAIKLLRGEWNGKISVKLKTIATNLKNNEGLLVVKVFGDSDNYMALNREHSMICACFGQITNVRHGSPYGEMRSWSKYEVLNFGHILLYVVLKQCLIEMPNEINTNHLASMNK